MVMQIASAIWKKKAMVTPREVIEKILDPIRPNDLERRRRRLGLSRVALGRILGVDPATVFRRERGPLLGLWDYALRGIEAEAASKPAKQVVRRFKNSLDEQTLIPDQFAAQGHSYLAEKMNKTRLQHAQKKTSPDKSAANKEPATPGEHGRRGPSKGEIKRIADRAERAK
jgi:hypothetical protein